MLQKGLHEKCCSTFYGKKFGTGPKHQGLVELLNKPNTYLLYPGAKSRSLQEVVKCRDPQEPYNLVVLDGTWSQAKSMYFHSNNILQYLPQVNNSHNCIVHICFGNFGSNQLVFIIYHVQNKKLAEHCKGIFNI